MPSNVAIALQPSSPPSTVEFFWWTFATDKFAAWGQVIGAIATFLAVLVAVGISLWDHFQRKGDDRAQQASRARTVIATTGVVRSGSDPRFAAYMQHYSVAIENHGPSPVLEVVIEDVVLVGADGKEHPEWSGAKRPDDRLTLPRRVAEVIAAGSLEDIKHSQLGRLQSKIESGEAKPVVTFTFLDSDGYRWQRVGSGAPKLIKATAPTA